MDLEFKPDFEEARQRWIAFWKGEKLDRPLVSVVVPKPGVEPVEKPPYASGADGNYKPVIDQLLAWARTHEFIGEAIPFFHVEFGPDHFSSLLGADLKFHPDSQGTSWCVPFIKDWDGAHIRFQPDCLWYKRTVEFIRALRARCDGKILLAGPTLVAGLDCLAAIRGVENLLMDLLLVPDKVKTALRDVCCAYEEILKALSAELGVEEYGSINRHGMYSPGKINIPQCDFSCMISPEMFEEFEVPSLVWESKLLDSVEYHLDGPGALVHLPTICKITDIDVIQWVPGSGEAEKKDWTELYEKIDSFGKGQILWGDAERIKYLARKLRSRQLFFVTKARSRKEAESLLRELESIERRKR